MSRRLLVVAGRDAGRLLIGVATALVLFAHDFQPHGGPGEALARSCSTGSGSPRGCSPGSDVRVTGSGCSWWQPGSPISRASCTGTRRCRTSSSRRWRACRSRSSSTSSSRSRAVGSRRASNGGSSPSSMAPGSSFFRSRSSFGTAVRSRTTARAVRRIRFSSWTPTPSRGPSRAAVDVLVLGVLARHRRPARAQGAQGEPGDPPRGQPRAPDEHGRDPVRHSRSASSTPPARDLEDRFSGRERARLHGRPDRLPRGLLRTRLQRSGVADLVVELRSLSRPEDVRDAIARALGDPSLELAFWLPADGRYVDPRGSPLDVTDARRTRGHRARARREACRRARPRPGALGRARAPRGRRRRREPRARERAPAGGAQRPAGRGASFACPHRRGRRRRAAAARARPPRRRPAAPARDPARTPARPRPNRRRGRLRRRASRRGGRRGRRRTRGAPRARARHPSADPHRRGPCARDRRPRAARSGSRSSWTSRPSVCPSRSRPRRTSSRARRSRTWRSMRMRRGPRIALARTNGRVAVEVTDDGVGGADADGAGLRGLRDRVEALDGSLYVETACRCAARG